MSYLSTSTASFLILVILVTEAQQSNGFDITCKQVYPSEYAYEKHSVSRMEHKDANCREYSEGAIGPNLHLYDYFHCDGTQLRLTDSHFGSEMYNEADYYKWRFNSESGQLLFIFPTTVNLTTITLHYYSDSDRGLPRLRFYVVQDDFDIWDAPSTSYSHTEVEEMPHSEGPAQCNNVSINFIFNTRKVLLNKFSSTLAFELSEVEFFTCNDSHGSVTTYNSFRLTQESTQSTFSQTTTAPQSTSSNSDELNFQSTASNMVTNFKVKETDGKNSITVWIATGIVIAMLVVLTAIGAIPLGIKIRKSSRQKMKCDDLYSTLYTENISQPQPQSLTVLNDLYDRIELSPSTGQTEFISKTDTNNINNPSLHHDQHSIYSRVENEQPMSTAMQTTAKQSTYTVVNKKKTQAEGKEPVRCQHKNLEGTNFSSVVHLPCENSAQKHTNSREKSGVKGNRPKCNDTQENITQNPLQTTQSLEQLYTVVRKKTKESTTQNEEEPPPIPPQGVEQLYTAVNKKTQPTTANDEVESPPIPPHTVAELYTAVIKKPKARETDDEVEAPPVPPHTMEELYTAVQKNKK